MTTKETARPSRHERRGRFQRRRLPAARAGLRRRRRDDEGLAAGLHLARRGQMLRPAGHRRRARRGPLVRHSALRGRRGGPVRARRDRLFFERIPGRPDAEPLRDVQRKAQVRQPLGKGAGARLRLHRDRPLRHHRASRRSRRPAQGRATRARISPISSSACASRSSGARSRRSARWRSRRFARSRAR